MKTAAIIIERVSIVCPGCRSLWYLDHNYADEAGPPTRKCVVCGTRYRVPALAFRVGKAPR